MKNSSQKEFAYFFIDLYNSRKIFGDNQRITNIILKQLAKHLNKRFTKNLISNFEVRDGDGVLGGTRDLSLIVDIYEECLDFKEEDSFRNIDLRGVDPEDLRFYFGVGIGNITSGQDTFDSVHNINGTAVSNAKLASDISKKIIIYNSLPKREIDVQLKETINKYGNYHYRFQDFHPYIVTDNYLEKLLNPSFYLAYEKYVSNENQNKLFQMRKRNPNTDLYLIGKKLGYELVNDKKGRQKLSTQISNLLNKSNFNDQQILLRDIKSSLNNILLEREGII